LCQIVSSIVLWTVFAIWYNCVCMCVPVCLPVFMNFMAHKFYMTAFLACRSKLCNNEIWLEVLKLFVMWTCLKFTTHNGSQGYHITCSLWFKLIANMKTKNKCTCHITGYWVKQDGGPAVPGLNTCSFGHVFRRPHSESVKRPETDIQMHQYFNATLCGQIQIIKITKIITSEFFLYLGLQLK
jgi:hypothetical protein